MRDANNCRGKAISLKTITGIGTIKKRTSHGAKRAPRSRQPAK